MGEVIAVYGQGKMGLPLAQVLAKYFKVYGVDINKSLIDALSRGEDVLPEEPGVGELIKKNSESGSYVATTDFSLASKNATIHIILVPTLIKENKVDLSIAKSVAREISKRLKKGDIVITECTMPPGSTKLLLPILEESGLKLGDFSIAHAPERTYSGHAIRDIEGEYPKILGTSDARSLDRLKKVYETINSKGVITMPGVKEAELVKVFEGCYRDLNIALANELSYVCEREGVDAASVFSAANTQKYCKIHNPGYVGGHCIPYYPWFVIDEKTKLMKTGRGINEAVIERLISKCDGGLKDVGIIPKDAKIVVLGLTFRGGVREFEHSAAFPFVKRAKEEFEEVLAYDPLCSKEDYARFGVEKIELPCEADCAIVLADHDEFLGTGVLKSCPTIKVLIDGRGICDLNELRKRGIICGGLGK